jgi:hypothetical protein
LKPVLPPQRQIRLDIVQLPELGRKSYVAMIIKPSMPEHKYPPLLEVVSALRDEIRFESEAGKESTYLRNSSHDLLKHIIGHWSREVNTGDLSPDGRMQRLHLNQFKLRLCRVFAVRHVEGVIKDVDEVLDLEGVEMVVIGSSQLLILCPQWKVRCFKLDSMCYISESI